MAGRPGRVGLIPVRRSPDRGRLILGLQAVLLGCLALGAISLFTLPPSDSDCCLPPQVLGIFPSAEIGLLLLALGLRWWYGRHGPLALVDGAIVAPLPVFVAGSATELGWLWPAAAVGLAAGLAGAILSVVEVRHHPIERIAVAVAFLGLAVSVASVVTVLPIPALLLALTVWPAVRLSGPTSGPAGAAASRPRPAAAAPVRHPGEPPLIVGASGRLEPDVRAILGPRPADDTESVVDVASPAPAPAQPAAAPRDDPA